MALLKRNNIYYAYFRKPGSKTQRIVKSLGTTDRATAEIAHATLKNRLALKRTARILSRNVPGFVDERPDFVEKLTQLTAAPVVEDSGSLLTLGAMESIAITRKSFSTTTRNYWRRFVEREGAETLAAEITPQRALRYLDKYYSGGNGKNWNNAKSALNGIYKCCLVQAQLNVSPFSPINQKRVEAVEHYRNLTDEEIDRLLAVLPAPLKVMTMLSRYTSLRLKDCARITPSMLDREKLVLVIDPGKNKRFDEWVCCPLLPPLLNFLDKHCRRCRPDEAYAQSFWKRGEEWDDAKYSRQFRKYVRQLEIPDTESGKASFHSLRGSAITFFKEHGVNGPMLSDITGHDASNVEKIYARAVKNISDLARNWR